MTNLRAIFGLFLGLVIQCSHVQSSLAADVAHSCGGGEFMSCCDGLQACPCASEENPVEKPSPMVPAATDLKLLVSKGAEPINLEAPVCDPTDSSFFTASSFEICKGYAGVPLSVAFCRFVI